MPKRSTKKTVKLPKKKTPPPPKEEEDEGVFMETGICPECGERDGIVDYTPILVQFVGVRALAPFRHTRMCMGCWNGDKNRSCGECGETFNPRRDDTIYVCGGCYDRRLHADDDDE